MANNSVMSLLRAIGSFLMGSLRLILFIGCFITLFIQAIAFMMVIFTAKNREIQLPGSTIGGRDILFNIMLLFTALLGCYGAFYKHRKSIQAYAILTAIMTATLMLVAVYTMSPSELEKENKQFSDYMKGLSELYNWQQKDRHDKLAKDSATRQWDALQRLACCGLNGPKDWDKLRPSSIDDHVYPWSCCLETMASPFESSLQCTRESSLFKTGCMERIEQIEMLSLVLTTIYFIFQLMLCIIAAIVGNCSDLDLTQSASRANVVQQRQYYDAGRSYGPQLVLNEAYYQPPPDTKMHQSVYPTLHDFERGHNSPPPSYGAANAKV